MIYNTNDRSYSFIFMNFINNSIFIIINLIVVNAFIINYGVYDFIKSYILKSIYFNIIKISFNKRSNTINN